MLSYDNGIILAVVLIILILIALTLLFYYIYKSNSSFLSFTRLRNQSNSNRRNRLPEISSPVLKSTTSRMLDLESLTPSPFQSPNSHIKRGRRMRKWITGGKGGRNESISTSISIGRGGPGEGIELMLRSDDRSKFNHATSNETSNKVQTSNIEDEIFESIDLSEPNSLYYSQNDDSINNFISSSTSTSNLIGTESIPSSTTTTTTFEKRTSDLQFPPLPPTPPTTPPLAQIHLLQDQIDNNESKYPEIQVNGIRTSTISNNVIIELPKFKPEEIYD